MQSSKAENARQVPSTSRNLDHLSDEDLLEEEPLPVKKVCYALFSLMVSS